MTPRSGVRAPTDELLLGILLAVGGVAVGSGLNTELGTALALLGLLVGVGAYLVTALSAVGDPPADREASAADRDAPGDQ
ncbi:hypothetical protein [Salinirussus salinus]|jgi:hypothetical protein|uniref:hypothetical protein n=1 Tax=Salinirussus salinus TaxID=1198300 RepID=UPI00135CCEBA|nr:hypothetical protein [Salinirussus salinus]